MSVIVHLIPYCGIGGVERAAASMRNISKDGIEFHVENIFPHSAINNRWVIWNPWFFIRTLVRVWQYHPDVLIVSLWRACVAGILLKLIQPKLRLVVFLHFPKDVHLPDRLFTRIAVNLACRVWGDSQKTLTLRLSGLSAEKSHVISFVTDRIASMPAQPVCPTFVFWGRIHAQKGLCRSLLIFATIQALIPAAKFIIIGPDGGDLGLVRSQIAKLGLSESVQYLGPKVFAEIAKLAKNASFYLQSSELEGMAMSVVEAMQLGLVPVVTPVGEIANYAQHGKNAIVVLDDASAVANVLDLLDNDVRYQTMRECAVTTWVNQPLYKDSVLTACLELLHREIAKDVK